MTGALNELAAEARRRLPGPLWDFIEGGAGDERTVAANIEAFERFRVAPRILRGATIVDTTVRILGDEWAAPVGIAPLAYHGIADADGELATAAAAEKAGLPLVVSIMASRRLEEIATSAGGPLWFQLYPLRSRALIVELVRRAEAAGYRALILTVDTPQLGDRRRDARNEFRLPSSVRPLNLDGYGGTPDSPLAHSQSAFDPSADWEYVEWLRSVTTLPLLLKGILRGDDAALAIKAGLDGLIVSNHGGRQLDGAVATLDALPEVVEAVAGQSPVFLDGGIRRGSDVLVALALGACGVFLGRPVLHALAAGGTAGVSTLLHRIQEDLRGTMRMAGAARCFELDRSWLRPAGPAGVSRVFTASPVAAHVPPACSEVLAGIELHGSVNDELLDTMTFLNEIAERHPQAISFAPGRPIDDNFRLAEAFELAREYVQYRCTETGLPAQRIERSLLQYGHTAGVIRDLIAGMLAADEGINIQPESLVVTVGCQEAMVLVLRTLFAEKRDVLAVSSPCYVGVTGAARLLDIRVNAITNTTGDLASGLADAATRAVLTGDRIRALYVVPDAANPSGDTLSLTERERLLQTAEQHGVLLLEDSPYRAFIGEDRPPTLKALDRARHVVQLGSFAKTVYPGLRVGYVLADQRVRRNGTGDTLLATEIAKVKSMITLNTSGLTQAVLGGFLLRHHLSSHEPSQLAAAHYRAVLNRVLAALHEFYPASHVGEHGVRWNQPAGGFFLTLQVPFRADAEALRISAVDHGVIWTPMSYFHPEGGGSKAIRLSVSSLSEDEATDGIRRLARAIEAQKARQ